MWGREGVGIGPIEIRAPGHQDICRSMFTTEGFILGKLGHKANTHHLGND